MFDKFSERHIGVSNEKDLKAMLEVIGAKSVDELISQVIPSPSGSKKPARAAAEGMSEYESAAHIRSLADRNRCLRSFIGMGYYPCAVRPPSCATSSRTLPGTPPIRPTRPRSRRAVSRRCCSRPP